ncbi:MAG: DUF2290 domain-containing protein [Proteobacteria bacterium]|nr:DUF2290 domain-containing protein [Pseudomonadota bacterium]
MGVDQAWRSINAAYEEWADYLGNPNFCRQAQTLTWQSRQRIWLQNEFDCSAYQQLAEARQYSFVVAEDGGLIQLHYEFEGNVLLRASAGYYGSSQITLIERESTVAETLELAEPPPGGRMKPLLSRPTWKVRRAKIGQVLCQRTVLLEQRLLS